MNDLILATEDKMTRERFISEHGPVCTPKDCCLLVPNSTPKYWRDMARRGNVQAVKLGGMWLVNAEAVCNVLGL